MTTSELVDLASKIGGVGALVVTPIVGSFKYIKSRTFAVKLELSIGGEILKADGQTFLRVRSVVKNVGNSRVQLKPKNSYVRLCKIESTPDVSVLEPDWLLTVFVLQDAHALESGQVKDDFQIIKIPHSNYLALYIELGVTSRGMVQSMRGRDWMQTVIVNCKLKPETST